MSDSDEFANVLWDMETILEKLLLVKPNDRSELDRRHAIIITEYEKIIAYYKVYVCEKTDE